MRKFSSGPSSALCAASAGSWVSFDYVKEKAQSSWGKHGIEMRTSLEAIRGPQGVDRTLDLLTSGDRKKIVAGLNLLSGCGDEKAIPHTRLPEDGRNEWAGIVAEVTLGAPALQQLEL